MTETISLEVPLRQDTDGVLRVAGTRILLDTVVAAFGHGATPEEICQRYPTLSLADAYAVIGYYLRYRAEVEAYIDRREQAGAALRQELETRFSPEGIRDRLLARRSGAPTT